MASALGAALISTILEPMAAKAMDNGKRIVKYIADKAVDKAVDKVMDKPMDKVMAMVLDKVDGIVNIERDISKLQTTLYMIQDIVQVAEEKLIDKQGNPTVVFIQNWLRDLVDIAYEARDVLDDFNTFSSCIITAGEASNPVNFISSLVLRYFGGLSSDTSNIPLTVLNRLEKDIRSVTERFDVKIKESEKFNTLRSVVGGGGSESVSVDRRPEVGPYINKQRDSLFLGRKKVKEEIMDKLLRPNDDRVDVVVIWGMGGIGKTTLAQSIYNDERVKKVPRKWSCVGESKFCAKKVITKITGDSSTDDVESLQKKLVKKFEGNRFLIVLDDVWDVDGSEWDLLFNPLTEVGKGLIIITKREKEVCPALINIQTPYNLQRLSEEDSWSIFESCAYVNGKSDSTPDLKRIGGEIVKKLNGLPLALKVVGRSLLNKDSSTWTNFLESNEWKHVMSALRWSYNHLPRHLKTCFTYCALFPKDHVFDNEKVLVEMWMAHDLIQKEDVGAQYFEQLVNASLLQCVDGKYFKQYVMHDLIHDLALLVSNGEFATANSSLTNDQMETVRHITITRGENSKVPRLCKMEKLLTLYSTDDENDKYYTSRKDIRVFLITLVDVFNQLKSIRVLVLHSRKITYIPDCISELRHLRYLDVSKTEVKSLPDPLYHLYNLQMLAAPSFALALPIDIVNISSLRYVRASLSTCKGIGKLTSLRELSSIHVCEGDNIRELGDMQILRGKLRIEGLGNVEKLEDDVGALMDRQTLMDELVLEFDKQLEKSTISEEVLDALGCPPNLTDLRIEGYTGVKSPSWMVDGKHKFDKLQTLKLIDCPKLESLPSLGEMTSLKYIFLLNVGVKRLGKEFYGKFTYGKVFFPSLEWLDFDDMKGWEEWDDIIIENSSVSFFPRLTELKIQKCAKLVSLLPVENPIMNFRKSLSRLEIRGCPQLQSLPPDFHKLSSLKNLYISDCPQLQSLPPDFHKLSSLERLRIEECPQLQSLPPDFHKLSSLEELYINHCPQLQSLPPDFHKLSSLEELYINHCPQLQSLPPDFHKLSSLEELFIYKFSQLQSLPPDFHNLSSLKKLSIYDCPQLQSLPAYGCPLLYERCKDESGLDWHFMKSLSSLEIRDCDGLKRLQLDALVSLKELKISNCRSLVQITSAICEWLEIKSCRLLEKMDVARCDSLVVIKLLQLHQCESFRSLSFDIHGMDSLEVLRIHGCPKLELAFEDGSSSSSSSGNSVAVPIHKIFTNSTQAFRTLLHHELVSLEYLSIENLGGFENFDETEANNFCKLRSLKRLYISKCEDLSSLPTDFLKLSSLEELYINNCPQLQSLPLDFHKLSSLEKLGIYDCPQLQSLPPNFHKLSYLEKLWISDCPQLQSLPADGLPPSLSDLSIRGCPLLYERCKDESGLDWHKINHIPERWICLEDGFAKMSDDGPEDDRRRRRI